MAAGLPNFSKIRTRLEGRPSHPQSLFQVISNVKLKIHILLKLYLKYLLFFKCYNICINRLLSGSIRVLWLGISLKEGV